MTATINNNKAVFEASIPSKSVRMSCFEAWWYNPLNNVPTFIGSCVVPDNFPEHEIKKAIDLYRNNPKIWSRDCKIKRTV